jgi:hypothetical protein
MAGATQGHTQARSSDAKHYVEYEEYVDFQLEKTRSIVKRTDILTTLTSLAVAVIGYLFVFVVFDQWILAGGFGYASRVVLLGLMLGAVTATLVWRVLLPFLRQVHPLYAARVIERSDPQLKSNLVNFVDIKLANAESAPVVLKSMQKRAAVELSHIDVEEAVDHRPLLRVAYALLAVVIVAAAYIVWSPKDPFASVKRILMPTAPIAVATETIISDVNPNDDLDVPARTIITIEADVSGKDADHAQILYTTNDHKYVDQTVEMRRIDENLKRYRGVLNGENGRGLLQSLTYRIVAGDAQTRPYVVNVIQPPGARLEDVHYVFPTYMQLEEKTTSGGDIDGWEGATVTVRATANVPVKRAAIVLTDTEGAGDKGEEISMQVTDGTKLSAHWKLEFRSDGTAARFYHVQVKTDKGEVDPDPAQYTYHIRPDQRPEVALLAPASDLTMPANGIIPLVIQASDPDFQLRSVALKIERRGESLPDRRLFEDRDLGQSFRGTQDFHLEPLGLTPGESIMFWVEVKDNKQPTANRASTPRIKVDIGKPVTADQVQKQLADEKQKQQDQLASAKEATSSDEVGKQQPRVAGDDSMPDDSQPPKERADRGDEKSLDRKPAQKQNDQDDSADDASPDQGNQPDRKRREPVKEEDALQRLLQRQQKEQQQSDQKADDQQQSSGGEKSTEKSEGEKTDRGQRAKAGQKSEKSEADKNQDSANDRSQSGNEGTDDKSGADDRQADRDNPQKQQPGDQSQADTKQQPDKKQQAADKKRQQQSPDEKNQTGDKGPANDKKDGGAGKKADGDKRDDAAKAAGSKTKAKSKADNKQDQPGESGNKPDGSKKDGGGQQGHDEEGSRDDKKPGDQAGPQDKTEPGPGAGKDDAAKKDFDSGDSERGDAGKQDDPNKDKQDAGKNGSDSQQKAGSDEKPATDQKNQAQGGAGKKDAADSDPASNSNDQSKSKGSPGKSDKPEGDQQSGDGRGEKSQKKGDGPTKSADDSDASGKEEPAADDPNAKKKQATGDETGEATGSDEADPDATKANDGLKKKEGSQPGAKKSSDDPNSDGNKSDRKHQPQEGTKQGSPDAGKADDRSPDGKEPTEDTGEIDEPPSARPDQKQPNKKTEPRPGQPPDVGNRDLKGDGRPQGQKSDQPQDGEKGSSAATNEGKPDANKPGAGDRSDEPGNTDPTNQKTGQPGDKKTGPGSKTKPSDDGKGQKKDGSGEDTGNKASEKGQGKPSDQTGAGKDASEGGKPGDKKGQGKKAGGKDGKGSGDSGSKPGDAQGRGDGNSSKPGTPGKGQQQSGSGISSPPTDGDTGKGPGAGNDAVSDADGSRSRGSSSDESPTPEEEKADLEAARKATNLVLQRLKSQLERGEVDQDLMDELGWKDKKDVERFVKYLEKGLSQPEDDNSPESQARRMQFEETLKSMDLGSETQRRSGSVGQERTIEQVGAKTAPVPREYQRVWESYTRSLSKQNDGKDAKDKKDKAAPDKAKSGKSAKVK